MNQSKINGLNDTEESIAVYSTTDYDRFKFLSENRAIKPTHVDKICQSFEAHNKLKENPIEVTPNFEVIDGQHRLMAAKKMGIPVYYKIDRNFDPKDIAMLNSIRKNWSLANYLKFYVMQGYEDYIQMKDFCEDIGMGLANLIEWISPNPRIAQNSFRNGTFKFAIDKPILDAILSTAKLIEIMRDQRKARPMSMFNKMPFHRACKAFFTSPLVDHDEFFARVEVCPHAMHVSVQEGYTRQLVDIYNYNKKKERLKLKREGNNIDII